MTFFRTASDGTPEILIYEEIGDSAWWPAFGPKELIEALHQAGDSERLRVRINSPGGDVFDGAAVYNLLAQADKEIDVVVDGLAASAASLIAMVGDNISMASNSMMMIHRAWAITMGNAVDLEATASRLRTIDELQVSTYQARTGLDAAGIRTMLDQETWMSADDAVAKGFATAKIEAKGKAKFSDGDQARARWNKLLASYRNTPAALRQPDGAPSPEPTPTVERVAARAPTPFDLLDRLPRSPLARF